MIAESTGGRRAEERFETEARSTLDAAARELSQETPYTAFEVRKVKGWGDDPAHYLDLRQVKPGPSFMGIGLDRRRTIAMVRLSAHEEHPHPIQIKGYGPDSANETVAKYFDALSQERAYGGVSVFNMERNDALNF